MPARRLATRQPIIGRKCLLEVLSERRMRANARPVAEPLTKLPQEKTDEVFSNRYAVAPKKSR